MYWIFTFQKRYFEVTNTYMKSTKRNFPGMLKFVLMSALLNAYLKFQGSIAVFYFYQNEKYYFFNEPNTA